MKIVAADGSGGMAAAERDAVFRLDGQGLLGEATAAISISFTVRGPWARAACTTDAVPAPRRSGKTLSAAIEDVHPEGDDA
jgi:hypothetical protein